MNPDNRLRREIDEYADCKTITWPHLSFAGEKAVMKLRAGRRRDTGKTVTMHPSNFSRLLFWTLPEDLSDDTVCEIGTGGGGIALAASKFLGARRVIGTDYDRKALFVARLNASANSVRNATWLHGSMFEPVKGARFDLIISNPSSMPDILLSESHAGIHRRGGSDGRFMVREIAQKAIDHLKPFGIVQFVVAGICDVEKTLREMRASGLGYAEIVASEVFRVNSRFTRDIDARWQFVNESGLHRDFFPVDIHRSHSAERRWFEVRYVVQGMRTENSGEKLRPFDFDPEHMIEVERDLALSSARIEYLPDPRSGAPLPGFSLRDIRTC